jgi:hypothetical protein
MIDIAFLSKKAIMSNDKAKMPNEIQNSKSKYFDISFFTLI